MIHPNDVFVTVWVVYELVIELNIIQYFWLSRSTSSVMNMVLGQKCCNTKNSFPLVFELLAALERVEIKFLSHSKMLHFGETVCKVVKFDVKLFIRAMSNRR